MIIEIDDNLTGEERKRELILRPTIYALEKFELRVDAAFWLGIDPKTLYKRIRYYKELHKYIKYNKELEDYPRHLWGDYKL